MSSYSTRSKRHVVAHHADHGRDVVVERREHGLVAVGPRHREVLQRDVVERAVLHGRVGGVGGAARGDVARHRRQHGLARRHAGEAVVHALRLRTRIRVRRARPAEPPSRRSDRATTRRAACACESRPSIMRVCDIRAPPATAEPPWRRNLWPRALPRKARFTFVRAPLTQRERRTSRLRRELCEKTSSRRPQAWTRRGESK